MGQKGLIINPTPVRKGGTGVGSLGGNSLLVGNGTSPVNTISLPANKQILRSDGDNWVPRVEGKILQVLQFEISTVFTTTTSSFIPVFSFAVTTKATNSNILLVMALQSAKASGAAWGIYSLNRTTSSPVFNASVYSFGGPFAYWPGGNTSGLYLGTVDGLLLDSPGVAGGQTVNYTLSMANGTGTGVIQMNYSSSAVSTAMVFEVAA